MVARSDDARIDAYERRAIWLAGLSTLALAFSAFGLGFGGSAAWKVALFVATEAALVVSVGLAALALVPGRATVVKIERVLFWAYAFFWVALLLTAVVASVSAIQSIGDPGYG